MTAERLLKDLFGFASFRIPQAEVIQHVLNGNDGLLIMPTGGGKSVCFQLPARVFYEQKKGMTVVISPLIALMKDQVDAARGRGQKAAFINSSQDRQTRERIQEEVRRGGIELLYVTPERFRKSDFLQALQTQRVALLAVDEAHCISQWGHDFRPDYSRLREIRSQMQDPPCLAVTATATIPTADDIVASLSLSRSLQVWNTGVRRGNIAIDIESVYGWDEKIRHIVARRHAQPGSAIIYAVLIQSLEKLSVELGRLGLEHHLYHGQLSDRERKRAQEAWLQSKNGLMLATPAFGLGIDKPDVRWVMHTEIPGSIEAWTQEMGRAGRDGQAAQAISLFDRDDMAIQMEFQKWSNPEPSFIKSVFHLIASNPLRFRQEGFNFLREQLNYFNRRDFRVETAVNQLERWGSLEQVNAKDWRCIEEPSGEFVDEDLFQLRLKGQKRKLRDLVEFFELEKNDSRLCRMQMLEAYFGLEQNSACKICDLCRQDEKS